MITKGIVEDIINPYSVKVRLPLLDGIKGGKQSVSTADLSPATICSLPNSANNISVGDIVFVGFEDYDISKPVILGHLYRETGDSTLIDASFRQLSTSSTTKLSKYTSIGDISSDEIFTLKNIRFNIQNQIDDINSALGRDANVSLSAFENITNNLDIIYNSIKNVKDDTSKELEDLKIDYVISQSINKHLINLDVIEVVSKIDDSDKNSYRYNLKLNSINNIDANCIIYYEDREYEILGVDTSATSITIEAPYSSSLVTYLESEGSKSLSATPKSNAYVDICTKYKSGKMEQHFYVIGTRGQVTSHNFLEPFAS